jgi:hypothetical protein
MNDTILRLKENDAKILANNSNLAEVNHSVKSGINTGNSLHLLVQFRRTILKERQSILDTLHKDLNGAIIDVNNELKLF